MKILINVTKLLYFDAETNQLNLGNFPETGKTINIENPELLSFFKLLVQPTEYDQAVKLLQNLNDCEKEEAEDAINYLMSQKILIDDEEYNSLTKDNFLNREFLYFYMLSNKNIIKRFDKYRYKNITILGVGGIGSVVAEMLVRAGFLNLTLVDSDLVESSNLIRQIGYNYQNIGQPKLVCISEHLKGINPNVNINIQNLFINNSDELEPIIKNSDFVVCTFDKPFRIVRPMVNYVCVKYEKPVLFSGFAEHVGMVGPFVIPKKTACLKCIEKEHLSPINNIKNTPSYGPLCGVIGNLVADEVMNYFLKFKKTTLQNKTLMLNLYNHKNKIVKWQKKENCSICGGNYDC